MASEVVMINSHDRESQHGSPRVTTKALHFWGHCSLPPGSRRRDAAEEDWKIVLDSYKEIEIEAEDPENPDLIYYTSMRAKDAFEATEDANQRAASEHTNVRLDRFSQARDWESYLWPTKIEIDGIMTQIVLHLYDAGRMTRLYPGRQGIPDSVVSKAVDQLLHLQNSTDNQTLSEESASKKTPKPPNSTVHRVPEVASQSCDKKQPDETRNSQPKHRHRRWNRRFKRSSKDAKTHLDPVNEDFQYDSMLPWAPRLLSRRIPKNLKNLPYLMVGSNPDDFGDSLVFPLSVPGTKHVLGCLAISREWLESEGTDEQVRGSSIANHMFWNVNHIDIFPSDKSETQLDAKRRQPPEEYWEKFMQDRLLGLGWDHENAFDYQAGRFYQHDSLDDLAKFLSLYTYGHLPLVYPDEQDGPIAQPEEFFEQYCCLPSQRQQGTKLGDRLSRWLNPEGRGTNSGLLGKPLTVYDPDHGHQLWNPEESHPDNLPSCVHDLLQTAQDYYTSLDKLCVNKQLTQADFLQKVRHSTRAEDLRPSIRPLGEVLNVLKSGTSETDLRDDATKWLDDWRSATEIYSGESTNDDDDDNSSKDDRFSSGIVIEGGSDKALVPSEHLWTRELWSLIQQGDRIPYWCQKQIFNCTNMLLIEGIDKWLWQSGLPKTDFSEPFYFENYPRRSVKKSEEIDSQSNDYCKDGCCPFNAEHFTKGDWQGFGRVRAYALFQSGLCILSGFGTERNIEKGLWTILKAAENGCRFARAVIHPLAKAYNRMDLIETDHSEWIIAESKCSSHWALEDLRSGSLLDIYPKIRGSTLFEQILLKSQGVNFPQLGIGKKQSVFRNDSSDSGESLPEDSEPQSNKPPHYLSDCLSESALPILEPDEDPSTYHHIIRWTCCHGSSEHLDHLLQKGSPILTEEKLGEYLVLSLHRGNPDATLLLLSRGAKFSDHLEGLNPFFLLHNMPSERISELVRAFVDLDFDVNEKAEVCNVQFISLYPTMPDWPEGFYKVATRLRPLPLDAYIRGKTITPLRWAILQDNTALVQALVDHGAEFPKIPSRTVSRDTMPQKWPVDICNAPILDEPTYNIVILRIFLERHGEQADQAPFAETPLGLISMEPDTHERRLKFAKYTTREHLREVLPLLRKYQPHDDARLFWAAVMNNHEEIVKELIDEGLDIELRFKGMTPLHTSILHGRIEIFHILLDHGADVKALTTARGISAMHLLFLLEKDPKTELAMLEKLHSLLGDVDMTHTTFGAKVTPLHLAVLNSRVESVEKLIQLGANTTRVLEDDPMPGLRGALSTEWGHREAQKILSVSPEHDLRSYLVTPIGLEGLTPIGIIIEREDMYLPQDATKMLISLMTAPNHPATDMSRFYIRPDLKQTILHLLPLTNLAAKIDIVDRVKEIGELAGLDINTPDIHGDTPLHYAYAFGGAAPLEMWDHYHDADEKCKNIFGLTPLESRLWKFEDPSCPEEEKGVNIQVVTWGPFKPREVPSEEGSPLARFWWGLERGLAISQCWETKGRRMKRSRGGVDGIRLQMDAWAGGDRGYGRGPKTAFTMVQ